MVGPYILVVDDDQASRELLGDMLELEGYAVIATADASEALVEIERTMPRLILLDLWMPFVDGRTFVCQLKARDMSIPILVISAAPDGDTRAREIKAEGFLPKPFDRDDLLNVVKRLCSRAEPGLPTAGYAGLGP